MPRLTKDQWAEARIKWEADPTLTFEALGQSLGVSDVAVLKACKREGWVKSGNLESINRAAQVRADSAEVSSEVSGLTDKRPKAASIELSTDLRSKLIQAHRAEWRTHSKLYPLEEIKKTFEIGKSGKITSEMISIRQKGERIAWGMDDGDSNTTITIERSYGKANA